MRRAIVALFVALVAGARCMPSQSGLTASRGAAIRDSVGTALNDFRRYSAAAQWDSLMQLYSADSSFRWIENGRRVGIAGVRNALSGLPPTLRVETTYDSTEIAPVAPGIGVVTMYYQTRFVGSPTPVQFGGAMSMVWTHEPRGWRILSGHSSSATPFRPR